MENIKPCPYCGSRAEIWHDYNCDDDKVYSIHCTRCELRGPFDNFLEDSIDKWNGLPSKREVKSLKKQIEWLADCCANSCNHRLPCQDKVVLPYLCGNSCSDCFQPNAEIWQEVACQAVKEKDNEKS